MKIGVIHPSFRVLGGAEATTMHMLDALKSTNHNTTLYTIDTPKIQESQNFKIHKIKRINFPLFWRYQRMKEIQKLFKDSKLEDILIISSGGLVLENSPSKKIILYCHSTFENEYNFIHTKTGGFKDLYYRIIKKNLKNGFKIMREPKVNLIANSYYTKKEILRLFQKEANVVYPPVDTSKHSKLFNIPKENKVITLSRFSPEKNLEFAIKVMTKANLNYELFGNAKFESQIRLYNNLKNRVKSNNILLYCNMPESTINYALGKSKIYFHPSKETFGIAVIEAVSAGCIPIVPDNSAFKETLPIEELRYRDKDDAVMKLQNAIAGKYDALKKDLITQIKKFSVESFRTNILKEIDSSN